MAESTLSASSVPPILKTDMLEFGSTSCSKYFHLQVKRLQEQSNLPTLETNEETNAKFDDLLIFDLDSIVLATENFSLANKLGSGGFGPVYKGKLSDGREIAVKRLSRNYGQRVN
ncbi:hypothetical protein Scep_028620 [Stephania cephalantha]|uniref:Protein kinase domain-containing protein n=1 Tax=Stephania cephalantha TaxID=152367 RepID=A0AAP0EEH6_9MAGN